MFTFVLGNYFNTSQTTNSTCIHANFIISCPEFLMVRVLAHVSKVISHGLHLEFLPLLYPFQIILGNVLYFMCWLKNLIILYFYTSQYNTTCIWYWVAPTTPPTLYLYNISPLENHTYINAINLILGIIFALWKVKYPLNSSWGTASPDPLS